MEQQEDMDKSEIPEQPEINQRQILSRVGWAMFLMVFSTLGSQIVLSLLVSRYFPDFYNSEWYEGLITILTAAGIGYPVFFKAIKKVPDSKYGEPNRLSLGQLLASFIICVAFMYISNLIGMLISNLIKGNEVVNPLEGFLERNNLVVIFVYVVILAPILEEIVFRKVLLDKLRRFGDGPAILFTGIAFGLFHLNVSQFFYAVTLGIIFAYIAIRTNTIRYTIIIHMLLNTLGMVIAPLVAYLNNPAIQAVLSLWVIGSMITGIVLFFKNKSRILLQKGEMPVEKKSVYFLNIGTILFLIISMAMMVMSILAE